MDELSPETAVASPSSVSVSVAASTTSLPRKRRHFKSRLGCGICKRRKIKCDESRPGCANCAKHGVECDFKEATPERPTARSLPTTPLPTAPLPSRPQPAQTPLPLLSSAADGLHSQPLQIHHLELLHNYCTLTSYTLSSDPILRNVWRINVPQEGFKYEFVLRSVFALSALHMASYTTDAPEKQRYLQMARAEHGVALRDIATALSQASADNCSALHVSAAMTFMYAWAAPRQPGDIFLVAPSTPGSSEKAVVADWVFLMRGTRSITEMWSEKLLEGPFGIVLRMGAESMGGDRHHGAKVASAAWQATPEHTQLAHLRTIICKAAAADESEDVNVYERSLLSLERSFCYSYGHGTSIGTASATSAQTSSVYYWLYCMEDEFVDLIVQRRPLALVMFAHFCVLLRLLSACWWMQGWSTHLMQEIWDLLDGDHRQWIRWPIEELGWRPSR
ncbi:hypothetical protein SEUCBS139899_002896 [Sporothrix eucalyptigena]|uniref:Zn(2)-C6 fungal-type domain-containing protein n=1 Tax=Sporothrix eucalyptigena TaxID=1812306 RepID=A0ABP0BX63_9PEZI